MAGRDRLLNATEDMAADAPQLLDAGVAKKLDEASRGAFSILDPKGNGFVTKVSLLLSLQRCNLKKIRNAAPRIEAWIWAMAHPRTWKMVFEAVNTSKNGRFTLSELSTFCRHQAEDTLREVGEREAELLAQKGQKERAAIRIQSVARARAGRNRGEEVKQRRDSAILIQSHVRRRSSKLQVVKKRQQKRRAKVKQLRIEKYRKEMQNKQIAEKERYLKQGKSRRKSLSERELQKVSEKTRQRAAQHFRKLKAEKQREIQEKEKEQKSRVQRLASIPGYTRNRCSSKKSKGYNQVNSPVREHRKRSGSKRTIPFDRKSGSKSGSISGIPEQRDIISDAQNSEINCSSDKIISEDDHAVEQNLSDSKKIVRKKRKGTNSIPLVKKKKPNPTQNEEISSKAKALTVLTEEKEPFTKSPIVDDPLIFRVYSANVAAGQNGIGFQFAINKDTEWEDFVEKVSEKFVNIGTAQIRHEDGRLVTSLSDICNKDRLFALGSHENWPFSNLSPNPHFAGIDMNPIEHSPLLKTGQPPIDNNLPRTFEAPFMREVAAGRAPTIFEIRDNETLSVTSVGGTGRLVVSVFDRSQVLRVPNAVVFDSNAWFFLRGKEAAMPTTLRFPGGYFYHFNTEGPIGVAHLSVRFVITSTFSNLSSPAHRTPLPDRLKKFGAEKNWTTSGVNFRHGPMKASSQSMKSLHLPGKIFPAVESFSKSTGGVKPADQRGNRSPGLTISKSSLSVSLRLPALTGVEKGE